MKYTENYGFDKPEGTDFVDVEHFNANTEQLDKLLCPEYTEEKTIAELQSGEKLSTAFGKLAKAVSDYISHKADQVAHITAAERTAWNAKLGAEKIAANLTTTEAGMLLDATMGKQLNENYETLKSRVDTINSRLGAIKSVKDFSLSTDTPCEITNLKGAYILVSFQGGAVATIGGIGFLMVSDYTSGGGYHPMAGGDALKKITAEISSNTVKFNNSTGFDTWCKLYKIY